MHLVHLQLNINCYIYILVTINWLLSTTVGNANHYIASASHIVFNNFSVVVELSNICMYTYNENEMFVRLFRITLHLRVSPRWATWKRVDWDLPTSVNSRMISGLPSFLVLPDNGITPPPIYTYFASQ